MASSSVRHTWRMAAGDEITEQGPSTNCEQQNGWIDGNRTCSMAPSSMPSMRFTARSNAASRDGKLGRCSDESGYFIYADAGV